MDSSPVSCQEEVPGEAVEEALDPRAGCRQAAAPPGGSHGRIAGLGFSCLVVKFMLLVVTRQVQVTIELLQMISISLGKVNVSEGDDYCDGQ